MAAADIKSLLGESAVALILGNDLSAHRLSYRLLKDYGIGSLLCGPRENLLNLLNLECGFLQLDYVRSSRLAIEQLNDFAAENSEYILILLVSDAKGKSFVSQSATDLESKYIISDNTDIETLDIIKSIRQLPYER